MAIDFHAELNAAQLAAVTAGDGPHLVVAAAGTGKTRTLVHRVAWLLQEKGIAPWHIWLLTFTNRAAKEMLERAAQLTPMAADVPGGTFHHMANRILRRHALKLGYPEVFSILDEDDSQKLLKACIADLSLKDKAFPKPAVIGNVISLAANRCTSLADDIAERFGHLPKVKPEDVQAVADLYAKRKRELGAMDFDDLLVNAVKLLREHPDVAREYQERVQYLLVDEYQDTNRLQSEFIALLCKVHSNLMAVGDDFQSIYGWRGADVRHILGFEGRHPGAKVIKLEENYRSAPGILAVANKVIAGNPEQYQKVLRAARNLPNRPVCVSLANGIHQAKYVISEIRKTLQRPGVAPKDIAVLYRAHYHALDLQMELARQRIPFVMMSGLRFFEQAHIKDLCAPLRLIANPGDMLAAQRLLELFPKVGPKKSAGIFEKLGRKVELGTTAGRLALLEAVPAEAAKPLKAFFDELFPKGADTTAEETAATLQNPGDVVQAFLKTFYSEYLTLTFDNAPIRLEDAGALIEEASRYESTTAFIEEVALMTNLDAKGRSPTSSDADAIRLSTIHQAKGLEWKTVFILWAVEGMLPSGRALDDEDASASGAIAEERRLFYVAVTRAKDDLTICVPKTRRLRDGTIDFTEPSRFLDDLDAGILVSKEPPVPADAYPPMFRRGGRW